MLMISLISVKNYVDENNMPVGHVVKTITDIKKIFHNEKTEIIASKEYLQMFRNKGKALPYSIDLGKNNQSEKVGIICNYVVSLLKSNGDVLVYVDISEPLLWGIALLKMNRKIVAITYENWDIYVLNNLANRPVRKFLVEKGLKRLDGCIVTSPSYTPKVNYIRIPDYYITEEILRYSGKKKKEGCVFVGEIRKDKDVAGLAHVISRTNINLVIAGSFRTKELYNKVRRYQSENIKIINKNLTYEEYLEYLSDYKYVVLPYDMGFYDGRTSGVLLEGIFVGAVPIAPAKLLEQNRIQGLGYRKISEIPDLISQYEKGDIILKNDLRKYQYETVSSKMKRFIRKQKWCDAK
jgi:hypothetical protein